MWLVVKHTLPFHAKFHTQMFFFYFQSNGDAVKKLFNAIWVTLLASTQQSFVMATSIVLMTVMKDLVVGYKFN